MFLFEPRKDMQKCVKGIWELITGVEKDNCSKIELTSIKGNPKPATALQIDPN